MSVNGYSVEGKISYQSQIPGDATSVDLDFRAEVQGCRWLITTVGDNPPHGRITHKKGFDGTNLYNLTVHTVISNSETKEILSGLIESNSVPVDGLSLIGSVWLALASGCSLEKSGGKKVLQPFWAQDDRKLRYERFETAADWSFLEGRKLFPRMVAYMNDGIYRLPDKSGKGREEFSAPPPYDRGYTNVLYEALAYQDYNGVLFPVFFEISRFMVPRSGIPPTYGNLALRSKTVGTVTNISGGVQGTFTPGFNGEFNVKDDRFAAEHPSTRQIIYPINNGDWYNAKAMHRVNKETIINEAILKKGAGLSAVDVKADSLKRILIWTFVLTTFALIYFVIKQR